MSVQTEVKLTPILDLTAAAPLRDVLLGALGRPVTLDAGDVERVGGLCVQVLLCARRRWGDDDVPFSIRNASDGFVEGLAVLGAGSLLGPTAPAALRAAE